QQPIRDESPLTVIAGFVLPAEPQPSAAARAAPELMDKTSNEPQVQFEFAKFLIEVAQTAPDLVPDDPKAIGKHREALMSEGLHSVHNVPSGPTAARSVFPALTSRFDAVRSFGNKKKGPGLGRNLVAYPEAKFFLANCYGNGLLGLLVDHDKAFALYVQAFIENPRRAGSRRGNVQARDGPFLKMEAIPKNRFSLELVGVEKGWGGTGEGRRALTKLNRAPAILLNGLLGQQKNPREAVTWPNPASAVADEQNPHALHELCLCYETAGIPNLIPDEAYARELFTQAAQLGYAPSQFKIGCYYEYGALTCPVDPRRSIS
ncbi:MAG: hypothetical protein BJ554DRAFT_2406, partial [Olpidium bornovanus]